MTTTPLTIQRGDASYWLAEYAEAAEAAEYFFSKPYESKLVELYEAAAYAALRNRERQCVTMCLAHGCILHLCHLPAVPAVVAVVAPATGAQGDSLSYLTDSEGRTLFICHWCGFAVQAPCSPAIAPTLAECPHAHEVPY